MQTDFLSFLVVKLFRSVPRLLILTPFCFPFLPSAISSRDPSSSPQFPVPFVQNQPAFLPSFPASSKPGLFYLKIFSPFQSPADPPLVCEFLFFAPVFSLLIKSPFGPLFLTACLQFAWVCPWVRPSGFEYNKWGHSRSSHASPSHDTSSTVLQRWACMFWIMSKSLLSPHFGLSITLVVDKLSLICS